MSIHSEIDDTLRRLGSVEPPAGLEKRIHLRLLVPAIASRFRWSRQYPPAPWRRALPYPP